MESDFSDFTIGEVAQKVERKAEALGVIGSIPVLPTKDEKFMAWARQWSEIDGGFIYGSNCVAVGIIDKNL